MACLSSLSSSPLACVPSGTIELRKTGLSDVSTFSRRIRVVFVLTALTLGGAEMMLWKLLSRIDRKRFDPYVIGLSGRADHMLDRFHEIDIPCELLGMRPRFDASWRVLRLAKALRMLKPDIVQGWLYHGNVAATLAVALTRSHAPVMWNVRGTLPSASEKNWRSSLIIRLSGLLSSTPARIINNSVVSAVEHEERLGYGSDTGVLLANGFDTELFRPRPDARIAVRAEHGVAPETVVVGLVGRYHPMKDHANFLKAAARLHQTHSHVHYVMTGSNVDSQNRELSALVSDLGLRDVVRMLGRRHDMENITAALDIACSASAYGEGFPNVIGEAMSCAVPCAVTDVGDSARIVADTGQVVPPCDPASLAHALRELVDGGSVLRTALGTRARERIIQHFSLDVVVRQYEELYTRVHDEHAPRPLVAPSVRPDER
jgi:glycosyltransferase involved in cell wall biosynthesis